MSNFYKKLKTFLNATISHKSAYLSYALLALLFILPILVAGVDYIDDTSRKLEGSYQWGGLGRVLTEALMHVVTFSSGDMVDVGNLAQILAIPLLALAGYLVARLISQSEQIKVRDWLVGALIVVNPLLLPNLSFRFDSLSMILGYTLSIAAGYLFLKSSGLRRYVIPGLLLLASVMLYQVTVMMFAVIVVIGFVGSYIDFKKGTKKYLFIDPVLGAFTLGAAFLLYFGIVKAIGFKFLVGQRSELVSANLEGLKQIKQHYEDLHLVLSEFLKNPEGLLVIGAVLLLGLIAMVLILFKQAKKTKIIDTLCFILLPLLLFVIILGPLVLMQSAISMQLRVMMAAIGIPLFCLVLANALPRLGYKYFVAIGVVIGLLFIAYSLNLSFVYGSALRQQREFDRVVYQTINYTLTSEEDLYKSKAIYIGGEASYSMTVQNLIKKRPILDRMDLAGDNTRWFIFNGLKDSGVASGIDQYSATGRTHDLRLSICSSLLAKDPLEKTEYFSLYTDGSGEYLLWLTDPFTNKNLICDVN